MEGQGISLEFKMNSFPERLCSFFARHAGVQGMLKPFVISKSRLPWQQPFGELQAVLTFQFVVGKQRKQKLKKVTENMNENVTLKDPSRHCIHNSVALCALTFKIVVLAWNRSKQKKISLLQFHVNGCLVRPNSLRRLLLSLDRTDFAFKRNNPGWQVCYASLSLSFQQGLSLTFET